MPECAACDRYFAPNAVTETGGCPVCGEPIHAATATRTRAKIPWHFWLILVLAAGYLGWRAIEGIIWVGQSLF